MLALRNVHMLLAIAVVLFFLLFSLLLRTPVAREVSAQF